MSVFIMMGILGGVLYYQLNKLLKEEEIKEIEKELMISLEKESTAEDEVTLGIDDSSFVFKNKKDLNIPYDKIIEDVKSRHFNTDYVYLNGEKIVYNEEDQE